MKFNLNKVKESYERAIEKSARKHSERFSKIFHDRIKYLLKQLEPEFKVTSLVMGMGGWTFKSEPFEVQWDDGTIEIPEKADILNGAAPSFDKLFDRSFNYCWTPTKAEEKHWKIIDELREILDYLNEDSYLELFEFDKRD